MQLRNLSVSVILTVITLGSAMAVPSVRLHAPPLGRYGIEDLWKATVTSDTVCDAWFEGFVHEARRGQVFHATTRPFRLALGSRVYQYRDVRIDRSETASGYEAFVTRSGQLPEGEYRFRLILQPFGVGDSFGFETRPMGPPRLISPRDSDTVRVPYPQFIWTPPTPAPRGRVTYTLKLVKLLPGQSAEEALRANRPWFTRSGIPSTSFAYPTSASALDSAPFAWQVTAEFGPGIAPAVSELRRFQRRFALRPPRGMSLSQVTVTRRVERVRTHFRVFLDVKVLSDIEDLKIQVWNTGFQCIPETDAQGANIAATGNAGTRTKWWGNWGNRSGGSSFTLSYHAVPILVPDMFWYQWYSLCDSVVVTYRQGGGNYIRRPDLIHRPMAEVEAAFKSANFVVVTCPARLYPAYDNNDVNYLLRFCGQLARKKDGVLGFTEPATTAPQLKAMLRGDGAWGSELAPAFRTWAGGYVLLVGEQNIVPAWEVTGLNVKWSGGSVTTRVRLSDFPYSDCTGDWIVDLKVGRAIGRSALELNQVVASAVTYPTTAKPASATLVSGYDSEVFMWVDMIYGCNAGAARLRNTGVSAVAAHIGALPSAEKLGALQSAVQGRKFVSYFGHGNVNVWCDVIPAWDVASLGYAGGNWVTAFSCLTGNYANDNAICRAFTNKPGTLGYIGATEVSSHNLNADLQSAMFWNFYEAGWSPGTALFGLKYFYSLFGNAYSRLAVYEYNLYGCPK
ncbi:MAG: C25 family cysteine peptidase [bacterium]